MQNKCLPARDRELLGVGGHGGLAAYIAGAPSSSSVLGELGHLGLITELSCPLNSPLQTGWAEA